MSFTADLTRFKRMTVAKQKRVIKKSIFDLFSSIVVATPVDKGVLRNNWYAAINSPNLGTTTFGAPVGSATLNRIKSSLSNYKFKDTVYFTNNLPYANAIEYGHSAQAPNGMARINIARWESIVINNTRIR